MKECKIAVFGSDDLTVAGLSRLSTAAGAEVIYGGTKRNISYDEIIGRVQVVAMAFDHPGMAISMLREILAKQAAIVSVVFVDRHWSPDFAVDLLRVDARVLLPLDVSVDDFVEAFGRMRRGGDHYREIHASINGEIFHRLIHQARFSGRLTHRQMEVLQLCADGKANRVIAQELHISVKTVGFHRQAIAEKLEVDTMPQAISKAHRLGLIAPIDLLDAVISSNRRQGAAIPDSREYVSSGALQIQ